MFVFDLDYTLWPFWVDTHVSPPLKSVDGGLRVKDSMGEGFRFFDDVPNLLVGVSSLAFCVLGNRQGHRLTSPDVVEAKRY